jgi:hypothetical protein
LTIKLRSGIINIEREVNKMRYRVTFSMCHCEITEVELDEEDIEGKSEGEIEALVEGLARRQIRQECTEYDAEDMIEMEEMEDWE